MALAQLAVGAASRIEREAKRAAALHRAWLLLSRGPVIDDRPVTVFSITAYPYWVDDRGMWSQKHAGETGTKSQGVTMETQRRCRDDGLSRELR